MGDQQIDPITGDCRGEGSGNVDPAGDVAERQVGKRLGIIDKKRIAGGMGRPE